MYLFFGACGGLIEKMIMFLIFTIYALLNSLFVPLARGNLGSVLRWNLLIFDSRCTTSTVESKKCDEDLLIRVKITFFILWSAPDDVVGYPLSRVRSISFLSNENIYYVAEGAFSSRRSSYKNSWITIALLNVKELRRIWSRRSVQNSFLLYPIPSIVDLCLLHLHGTSWPYVRNVCILQRS